MRQLTRKQFSFLLFLALRRSDGSDGWTGLDELVSRVGDWQGQSSESAGKVIWRFTEYGWFNDHVENQGATTGPYRLRHLPRFLPKRDDALTFVSAPPKRALSARTPSQRVPDRTELQAYDLIAQYGFYLTPVIDLIYQRIGQPERLRDPVIQLFALRVLVTLDKVRGQPKRALERGVVALKTARRLKRHDDVCYLLDQVGGAYHILGNSGEGERYFREEIAYITALGTKNARFHLIGAYRGLAGTLREQGRLDEALEAITESANIAREFGNEEAERVAKLEEKRITGGTGAADESLPQLMPSHHPIALVMALNLEAERLLAAGKRDEAVRMAKRAAADAERLQLPGQVLKAQATLAQLGLQDFFQNNGKNEHQ